MSCGKPHETDCAEVLAEVWLFLDHECDDALEVLHRLAAEPAVLGEQLAQRGHVPSLPRAATNGSHPTTCETRGTQ